MAGPGSYLTIVTRPIAALNIFVNHFYVYFYFETISTMEHGARPTEQMNLYIVVHMTWSTDYPVPHHDTDKVSTTTFDAMEERKFIYAFGPYKWSTSSANTGIYSNGKEFGAVDKVRCVASWSPSSTPSSSSKNSWNKTKKSQF